MEHSLEVTTATLNVAILVLNVTNHSLKQGRGGAGRGERQQRMGEGEGKREEEGIGTRKVVGIRKLAWTKDQTCTYVCAYMLHTYVHTYVCTYV